MLTHPLIEETNKGPLLYTFLRLFIRRGVAFSIVIPLMFSAGCASHGPPAGANGTTGPARGSTPASPRPAPLPGAERGGEDLTLAVQVDGGHIERLALDDYVRGTVAAEMWLPGTEDPAVAERIFEVQALVARTYALANLHRHASDGFDLCSTTHCQIYRPALSGRPTRNAAATRAARWAEAIDQAVARTRGQAILYDDAPILALFHANCGGATSAAHAIWGGTARPYLTSVPDGAFCARAPGATWRIALTREALTRALDADPRTLVRGRLDSIDIVEADPAGRALLVALTGTRSPVVRGEELRLVLVRAFGPRSIRSPRFTVHRDGDSFTFEGTGIGHGAGLCQFGAMARLRAGASPAEVITFYYPGTTIGRWHGPRQT
jgi:stage II sporulation protein D